MGLPPGMVQGRYWPGEGAVNTCGKAFGEEGSSPDHSVGFAAWVLELMNFFPKAVLLIHFCSWFSLTTPALPSSWGNVSKLQGLIFGIS